MKGVGIGELPVKVRGQQTADSRLAGAGNSHNDYDHR
jgi:hypothetical protein